MAIGSTTLPSVFTTSIEKDMRMSLRRKSSGMRISIPSHHRMVRSASGGKRKMQARKRK